MSIFKSLSRKDNHRKSLMRNLATSLILYEEIKTTKAKAKMTKAIVENLIASAKNNDLVGNRGLKANLLDEKAAKKVREVLISRYKNQSSGLVTIINLGRRSGDGAEMAIIKLKGGIPNIIPEKNIKDKNAQKSSEKTVQDVSKSKTNP